MNKLNLDDMRSIVKEYVSPVGIVASMMLTANGVRHMRDLQVANQWKLTKFIQRRKRWHTTFEMQETHSNNWLRMHGYPTRRRP